MEDTEHFNTEGKYSAPNKKVAKSRNTFQGTHLNSSQEDDISTYFNTCIDYQLPCTESVKSVNSTTSKHIDSANVEISDISKHSALRLVYAMHPTSRIQI